MNKFVFALIAFVQIPLFGDDQTCVLNADSMYYRDNFLELVGNVSISHPPSTLTCASASVSYKRSEKEISQIELKKDVKITIDDKSYILCDRAQIYVSEQTGILFKGEDLNQIKYFKDPNFILSCNKMTIIRGKDGSNKMIAKGDVIIKELDRYTIFGQEAIREENGKISVYPEMIPNAFCSIETFHNTIIQAESIHFDPEKKIISLHKAKGFVSSEKYPKIVFNADIIFWNEDESILTLQGDIQIDQENFVSLSNDEKVIFNYFKNEINSITACGHTEMHRFFENGLSSYNLVSDGEVSINNKEKKIIIEKSKKQIHYSDALGSIFGDRLILNYAEEGRSSIPDKISLEGNVKLIGAVASGHGNQSNSTPQYALADELQYCCKKKEMKLFSHGRKRVLFYDSINNMQISAPGILYSKGKTSDKDVIKGLGDVRFHFMEQEYDQIKKRFNFTSEKE